MEQNKCERCGRLRLTKYLQQAVYIRPSLSEDIVVQSKANAYRCTSKSSCRKAAKDRNKEQKEDIIESNAIIIFGYKIEDKIYNPEDVTVIRHRLKDE